MPINITGTLMSVLGTAGSLQTAANTEALKKHQEELDNWEGEDWSQAPQGSKQQIAYQKASDTYYNSINQKGLDKERREYLKAQLGYTMGRPTKYQETEADKHIAEFLQDKAKNAKANIQSDAEYLLMSPVARAQKAYDEFQEHLHQKYGSGGKQ